MIGLKVKLDHIGIVEKLDHVDGGLQKALKPAMNYPLRLHEVPLILACVRGPKELVGALS